MTTRVAFAMLRKDGRVYRTVVVATLVLGLLPYAAWLGGSAAGHYARFGHLADTDWPRATVRAAYGSLVVLVGLAAAFGGTAFAAERRDRSADFLARLPPARRVAVVGKAIVVTGCLAAAFTTHALILASAERAALDAEGRQSVYQMRLAVSALPQRDAVRYGPERLVRLQQMLVGSRLRWIDFDDESVATALCTAVAAFGVAWCLSSVLSSPTLAAAGAVAVVAMAGAVVVGGGSVRDRLLRAVRDVADAQISFYNYTDADRRWHRQLWDATAVAAGLAAFTLGTAVYVRRVEP